MNAAAADIQAAYKGYKVRRESQVEQMLLLCLCIPFAFVEIWSFVKHSESKSELYTYCQF